jgi:diguanylate cyclase (GGDEF)-like protein
MIDQIWTLYENLNEIVYVADADTYELVYMNRKGREMYGIGSLEGLRGKKCYRVLQGSAEPCAFCNNKRLKVGQFEEWKFHNPLLCQTHMLKDTLLEEGGRRYRLELTFDVSVLEQQQETIREYMDNETLINEALRLSLTVSSPVESINVLLEYFGKSLKSDRAYIFEENDDHTLANTFEWCADGVRAEKENLQSVPPEALEQWYRKFRRDEPVIIPDLEAEKEHDPLAYECLAPQDIHSLVVTPLIRNRQIIGFYGVDNPPKGTLANISMLLRIMGHFLTALLRRRDLVQQLSELSLYDQLTGCGNRHAMSVFVEELRPEASIGVVYGDIVGLKRTNDNEGHQAGDALLVRAGACLRSVFPEYATFRIGGDEFLALCPEISEEEMVRRAELLRVEGEAHNVVISLGCVWRPDSTESIDKLLKLADAEMYQDKKRYYSNSRDRRRSDR